MAALAFLYGPAQDEKFSRQQFLLSLSKRAERPFTFIIPAESYSGWRSTSDEMKLLSSTDPVLAFAPSFSSQNDHFLIEDQLALCLDGRIYDADHESVSLTELADSFRQQGRDCIRNLYGRWSLIIADLEHRKTHLFRDPAGIQPLYYLEKNDQFNAVSECSPLRDALPSVHLNPTSVFELLSMGGGTVKTPVLTEEINELQPGTVGTLHWDEFQYTSERYFPLRNRFSRTSDQSERLRTVRRQVIENTQNALHEEEAVVLGLSSGLDSNILASLVKGREKITALSSSFPGFERDEFAASREAASHYGFDLRKVHCNADGLVDRFEEFVRALDLPVVTGGTFLKYELMRSAKKFGSVWLDGEGGDSLFAGLPDHHLSFALQNARQGKISMAWNELKRTDQWPKKLVKHHLSAWPANLQYAIARQIYPAYKYFRPEFLRRRNKKEGIFSPFERSLQKVLEAKYFGNGMHYSLRCHDRISHHLGIRCAMPLVEYSPLVETAMGLPDDNRIRFGHGKWILREVFRNELPECVLSQRDKYGLETPTRQWLRDRQDFFMDLLDASKDDEFIDVPKLKADFRTISRTGKSNPLRLFTLLSFLGWRTINQI